MKRNYSPTRNPIANNGNTNRSRSPPRRMPSPNRGNRSRSPPTPPKKVPNGQGGSSPRNKSPDVYQGAGERIPRSPSPTRNVNANSPGNNRSRSPGNNRSGSPGNRDKKYVSNVILTPPPSKDFGFDYTLQKSVGLRKHVSIASTTMSIDFRDPLEACSFIVSTTMNIFLQRINFELWSDSVLCSLLRFVVAFSISFCLTIQSMIIGSQDFYDDVFAAGACIMATLALVYAFLSWNLYGYRYEKSNNCKMADFFVLLLYVFSKAIILFRRYFFLHYYSVGRIILFFTFSEILVVSLLFVLFVYYYTIGGAKHFYDLRPR